MQSERNYFQEIFDNDDMLVIAAAGNSGDASYNYPASYPSIMSVAATDSTNTVAYFSQYNDQVDIAAPGVDVLSTIGEPHAESPRKSYPRSGRCHPL